MKKEDIINQETLWNYCYQKAKENVIKTWTFTDEEINDIVLKFKYKKWGRKYD